MSGVAEGAVSSGLLVEEILRGVAASAEAARIICGDGGGVTVRADSVTLFGTHPRSGVPMGQAVMVPLEVIDAGGVAALVEETARKFSRALGLAQRKRRGG